MKRTAKILSILLTLCLLAAFMPTLAFADDPVTIQAADYDALVAAIETANGTGVKTIIQLSQDMEITSLAQATLPTITGNVVLDLNGKVLEFDLDEDIPADAAVDSVYCIPADLSPAATDPAMVDKGVISVAAGASLQILNTDHSMNDVNFLETDDIARIAFDYVLSDNRFSPAGLNSITLNSSLIYSEGTLIIGSTDDADNTFALFNDTWPSTRRENPPIHRADVNAYAVTVNGADAVFTMNGGVLFNRPESDTKDTLSLEQSTYQGCVVNIENAYSAQFYGGIVMSSTFDSAEYIPTAPVTPEAPTSRLVGIRANTPNVYIFDVVCVVNYTNDKDKFDMAEVPQLSDIYSIGLLTYPAAGNTAFPSVFGGQFLVMLTADGGASTNHAYAVSGGYSYLDGGAIGEAFSEDIFFADETLTGEQGEKDKVYQCCFYSALAIADERTENGLQPADFATFRAFVDARTAENDACRNSAGKTVYKSAKLDNEDLNNIYSIDWSQRLGSAAFDAVLADLDQICGLKYTSNGKTQSGWNTADKTDEHAVEIFPAELLSDGWTVYCHPVFDLLDATVEVENQVYTGEEVKPEVTVTLTDGTVLTKDVDYEVSYANNTDPGEATVTVTGIGAYSGTINKTFKIIRSLSDAEIAVAEAVYTDGEVKPEVTVTLPDGTVLVKDVDYEVSYENNTQPGEGTATVNGIGFYSGVLTKTFTILRSISGAEVTVADADYTGGEVKPEVTVKLPDGTVLVEGTDYDVTYSDNTQPGEGTVTVTGKGDYAGTLTKTFTIIRSLSDATVKVADKVQFCKNTPATTKVTVIVGGKVLKKGVDYTVTYVNNDKPGTAKVIIKGLGAYTGQVEGTFEIVEPSESGKIIRQQSIFQRLIQFLKALFAKLASIC